jgi:hypothetical protein
MRVSDDRYSRDRLRLDLAVRFIRHEARTRTIRLWTGLTDDRIRKLYRSYLASESQPRVARHRGKSPQQASFFTRSLEAREDAAALASLLQLYGVLPRQPIADASRVLPNAQRGELLCSAYESFLRIRPASRISFEHAVFLAVALARADELQPVACASCTSLGLIDQLAMRGSCCLACGTLLAPGLTERAARGSPFPAPIGAATRNARIAARS